MRQLTRDDLNGFILKLFREEHCRITNNAMASNADFEDFIKSHLFFITATFSRAHSTSFSNPEYYMKCFRKAHYHLIKAAIGEKFRKRFELQPFTFFCLDADGSRFRSFGLANSQNLHVHALMLVNPKVLKDFLALNVQSLQSTDGPIDSIHVELFDPNRLNFGGLISYTTKAIRPNQDSGIFWDFLPLDSGKRFAAQERTNRLLNRKAADMSGENPASTKLEGTVVMSTSIQATDVRKAKIDDWVAKLRSCSDRTVDSILAFAKMLSEAEADVKTLGKGAIGELRKATGLSQSMLSKLKRVGDRATDFEKEKVNLPASLSTLYEMTMLDGEKFKDCVTKDQKRATRSDIKALRKPRKSRTSQILMSFATELNVDETKLAAITREIKEAVELISQRHGLTIKAASEPFEEEKVKAEKQRLQLSAAKAKLRKNNERARAEFKKFNKLLSDNGVKMADRHSRFVERFGNPYSQLMKLKDATRECAKHQKAVWLSDEERMAYGEEAGQAIVVQRAPDQVDEHQLVDLKPMMIPMLAA